MTYDQESRLATATLGSTTVYNEYRADGLRSHKDTIAFTPGATRTGTFYFYDRGNAVLETGGGGTVTAVNVHAPDGLVARKNGSTWSYYQFDQQGNTVTRSNASGTVVSGMCYDAYGLNFAAPTAGDCFRYNGRWGYYYDADLTLTLCQHRFYDPGAGRWINRDPISYAGSVNLYSYCDGDPAGRMDSSGNEWVYTPGPDMWHPGHWDKNEDGGWDWALSKLHAFLAGVDADQTFFYGEGSGPSNQLKNSFDSTLTIWHDLPVGKYPGQKYKGSVSILDAFCNTIFQPGNATQAFAGGFNYTGTFDGKLWHIRAANVTGTNSLFYHIPPIFGLHDKKGGIMGQTTQYYGWTMQDKGW